MYRNCELRVFKMLKEIFKMINKLLLLFVLISYSSYPQAQNDFEKRLNELEKLKVTNDSLFFQNKEIDESL